MGGSYPFATASYVNAYAVRLPLLMTQIFPGEVFANTTDFDTGIRQLIPRYDEMLDALTRCVPTTSDRILELGCGVGRT